MIGNGFATGGFEVMSEQSSWIQLGPLRNWMTIVAWGIGHEMKTPVARVAAVPGQGEKDQGTQLQEDSQHLPSHSRPFVAAN